MKIESFEHLESKIISTVELVKKLRVENRDSSEKIRKLEKDITFLSEENNSLKETHDKNSQLIEELEQLKTEREWIQGKVGDLLERIDKLETEIK